MGPGGYFRSRHCSTLPFLQLPSCHMYFLLCVVPEFDKEVFVGKGCHKLRKNIEEYDFESIHSESKSSGMALDVYIYAERDRLAAVDR